jgi:hypothetical protein
MGATHSMLSRVLLHYLGQYIKDIHLALKAKDVYRGDIHIENVELNGDGLNELLGLPFRVVSGRLGKLRLKIPWTRLRSEPCLIELCDLYIVLEPGAKVAQHGDRERKAALAAKEVAVLDGMGAARERLGIPLKDAAASPAKKAPTTKPGAKPSLSMRLLLTILGNVKVNVERVHIRVEERGGRSSGLHQQRPFAGGLFFQRLSLQTSSTKRMPGLIRKSGRIERLAVYWDTRCSYNVARDSSKDMERIIRTDHPGESPRPRPRPRPGHTNSAHAAALKALRHFHETGGHDYILAPSAIALDVELDDSFLGGAGQAKPPPSPHGVLHKAAGPGDSALVKLHVTLQTLRLEVDQDQYTDMMGLLDRLSAYTERQANVWVGRPETRPTREASCPSCRHCKHEDCRRANTTRATRRCLLHYHPRIVAWWRYAVRASLQQQCMESMDTGGGGGSAGAGGGGGGGPIHFFKGTPDMYMNLYRRREEGLLTPTQEAALEAKNDAALGVCGGDFDKQTRRNTNTVQALGAFVDMFQSRRESTSGGRDANSGRLGRQATGGIPDKDDATLNLSALHAMESFMSVAEIVRLRVAVEVELAKEREAEGASSSSATAGGSSVGGALRWVASWIPGVGGGGDADLLGEDDPQNARPESGSAHAVFLRIEAVSIVLLKSRCDRWPGYDLLGGTRGGTITRTNVTAADHTSANSPEFLRVTLRRVAVVVDHIRGSDMLLNLTVRDLKVTDPSLNGTLYQHIVRRESLADAARVLPLIALQVAIVDVTESAHGGAALLAEPGSHTAVLADDPGAMVGVPTTMMNVSGHVAKLVVFGIMPSVQNVTAFFAAPEGDEAEGAIGDGRGKWAEGQEGEEGGEEEGEGAGEGEGPDGTLEMAIAARAAARLFDTGRMLHARNPVPRTAPLPTLSIDIEAPLLIVPSLACGKDAYPRLDFDMYRFHELLSLAAVAPTLPVMSIDLGLLEVRSGPVCKQRILAAAKTARGDASGAEEKDKCSLDGGDGWHDVLKVSLHDARVDLVRRLPASRGSARRRWTGGSSGEEKKVDAVQLIAPFSVDVDYGASIVPDVAELPSMVLAVVVSPVCLALTPSSLADTMLVVNGLNGNGASDDEGSKGKSNSVTTSRSSSSASSRANRGSKGSQGAKGAKGAETAETKASSGTRVRRISKHTDDVATVYSKITASYDCVNKETIMLAIQTNIYGIRDVILNASPVLRTLLKLRQPMLEKALLNLDLDHSDAISLAEFRALVEGISVGGLFADSHNHHLFLPASVSRTLSESISMSLTVMLENVELSVSLDDVSGSSVDRGLVVPPGLMVSLNSVALSTLQRTYDTFVSASIDSLHILDNDLAADQTGGTGVGVNVLFCPFLPHGRTSDDAPALSAAITMTSPRPPEPTHVIFRRFAQLPLSRSRSGGVQEGSKHVGELYVQEDKLSSLFDEFEFPDDMRKHFRKEYVGGEGWNGEVSFAQFDKLMREFNSWKSQTFTEVVAHIQPIDVTIRPQTITLAIAVQSALASKPDPPPSVPLTDEAGVPANTALQAPPQVRSTMKVFLALRGLTANVASVSLAVHDLHVMYQQDERGGVTHIGLLLRRIVVVDNAAPQNSPHRVILDFVERDEDGVPLQRVGQLHRSKESSSPSVVPVVLDATLATLGLGHFPHQFGVVTGSLDEYETVCMERLFRGAKRATDNGQPCRELLPPAQGHSRLSGHVRRVEGRIEAIELSYWLFAAPEGRPPWQLFSVARPQGPVGAKFNSAVALSAASLRFTFLQRTITDIQEFAAACGEAAASSPPEPVVPPQLLPIEDQPPPFLEQTLLSVQARDWQVACPLRSSDTVQHATVTLDYVLLYNGPREVAATSEPAPKLDVMWEGVKDVGFFSEASEGEFSAFEGKHESKNADNRHHGGIVVHVEDKDEDNDEDDDQDSFHLSKEMAHRENDPLVCRHFSATGRSISHRDQSPPAAFELERAVETGGAGARVQVLVSGIHVVVAHAVGVNTRDHVVVNKLLSDVTIKVMATITGATPMEPPTTKADIECGVMLLQVDPGSLVFVNDFLSPTGNLLEGSSSATTDMERTAAESKEQGGGETKGDSTTHRTTVEESTDWKVDDASVAADDLAPVALENSILDATVHIGSIIVELHRPTTLDELAPLARLSIVGLEVAAIQDMYHVDAGVCLDKIELVDIRGREDGGIVDSLFWEVFTISGSDASKHKALRLCVKQTSLQPSTTAVIGSVCVGKVELVMSTLLGEVTNFTPPAADVDAPLPPPPSSTPPVPSLTATTDDDADAVLSRSVKFRFGLDQARVRLVQNLSKRSSPCMDLSLGLKLSLDASDSGKATARGELVEIKAERALPISPFTSRNQVRLDEVNSPTYTCLETFSVEFGLKREATALHAREMRRQGTGKNSERHARTPVAWFTDMSMNIDNSINVHIGYGDLSIIRQALANLSPGGEEGEGRNEDDNDAGGTSSGAPSMAAADPPAVNVPVGSPPSPPPSWPMSDNLCMKIDLPGVQVMVINDLVLSNTPLLSLALVCGEHMSENIATYLEFDGTNEIKEVHKLPFIVVDFTHMANGKTRLCLDAYMSVAASFFNPGIEVWEPLLERWTIRSIVRSPELEFDDPNTVSAGGDGGGGDDDDDGDGEDDSAEAEDTGQGEAGGDQGGEDQANSQLPLADQFVRVLAGPMLLNITSASIVALTDVSDVFSTAGSVQTDDVGWSHQIENTTGTPIRVLVDGCSTKKAEVRRYRCVTRNGARFRNSKDMNEYHLGVHTAASPRCNAVIEAVDDGNGWLTVSNVGGSTDQLFVPTHNASGDIIFEPDTQGSHGLQWSRETKTTGPTVRVPRRQRSLMEVDAFGRATWTGTNNRFGRPRQYMHADRKTHAYHAAHISVELGKEYHAIEKIPVGHSGIYALRLARKDSASWGGGGTSEDSNTIPTLRQSATDTVLCEVTVDSGVRIVRLHSLVAFLNQMDVPVAVTFRESAHVPMDTRTQGTPGEDLPGAAREFLERFMANASVGTHGQRCAETFDFKVASGRRIMCRVLQPGQKLFLPLCVLNALHSGKVYSMSVHLFSISTAVEDKYVLAHTPCYIPLDDLLRGTEPVEAGGGRSKSPSFTATNYPDIDYVFNVKRLQFRDIAGANARRRGESVLAAVDMEARLCAFTCAQPVMHLSPLGAQSTTDIASTTFTLTAPLRVQNLLPCPLFLTALPDEPSRALQGESTDDSRESKSDGINPYGVGEPIRYVIPAGAELAIYLPATNMGSNLSSDWFGPGHKRCEKHGPGAVRLSMCAPLDAVDSRLESNWTDHTRPPSIISMFRPVLSPVGEWRIGPSTDNDYSSDTDHAQTGTSRSRSRSRLRSQSRLHAKDMKAQYVDLQLQTAMGIISESTDAFCPTSSVPRDLNRVFNDELRTTPYVSHMAPLRVKVSCPYWFVNRTERDLAIVDKDASRHIAHAVRPMTNEEKFWRRATYTKRFDMGAAAAALGGRVGRTGHTWGYLAVPGNVQLYSPGEAHLTTPGVHVRVGSSGKSSPLLIDVAPHAETIEVQYDHAPNGDRFIPSTDDHVSSVELKDALPRKTIEVTVVEGRDLTKMDFAIAGGGKSDPYVIVKFGKKETYKSEVIKTSLNPTWNFTCTVGEGVDRVAEGGKMTFVVYDWDKVGMDDKVSSE